MDTKYFAKEFIQIFPDSAPAYHSHLADYGEILGHVFFGDVINQPLSQLLYENTDKALIGKYINFIESMYASDNSDVQNIVDVTILAYLGDDDTVLKHAFNYFSEDLMTASKKTETGYGRRNIIISYRRGKVYARW